MKHIKDSINYMTIDEFNKTDLDDLNYNGIIYIPADETIMSRCLEHLETLNLGKWWRAQDKFFIGFWIENCDFQDLSGIDIALGRVFEDL